MKKQILVVTRLAVAGVVVLTGSVVLSAMPAPTCSPSKPTCTIPTNF
jgi:hypothetical protein